jgi:methionyl-tRNA synthetase
MSRRILVTSALPYANGPIHLGHLVEYLQTDIWVRFQRLRGHRALYLCADDTHGTAIMMRAQSEGRSEEAVIADASEAHQRDFAAFQIQFDHYGSTHSESNRKVATRIWNAMRQAGMVVEREVTQLFDPDKGVFLADRFVKGTCPNCGAADQYGDNCVVCSATYSPSELKDPKSTLSGATPVVKSAPHLFIELEKCHAFLEDWTQNGDRLQPEIANYLKGHFLSKPLRDWDVSRPAPYFGFEIPDAPGHYWYVWFDAPIGYIASSWDWCEKQGEKLADWWESEDTEIHHFIGKDITYFHTLFWPAMLKIGGFSLPKKIHIHGFLTVNGEKMSKSTGTFVMASTYLKHLDPAYLRYYYAYKLGTGVEDLDMNLEDFAQRVNSDLVGKVVNLVSRTSRFVQATGLSESYPEDGGLFTDAAGKADEIAEAYENKDYARAMRTIMALADRANEYVDRVAPWALKKQPGQEKALQDACTVMLNLYRQLVIYLAPVLPKLAEESAALLNAPIQHWDDAQRPIVGTAVNPYQHLMQRVDLKKVSAMIDETAEAAETPAAAQAAIASAASAASADDGAALAKEPIAAQISIDAFTQVDLRVARILKAEHVPKAEKLLKLTVSLGGDSVRTVFAGIKAAYDPSTLEGRLVVVVANLAPRQMKFGLSEGMVVCAGEGGSDLYLVSPDSGAKPGQRLR